MTNSEPKVDRVPPDWGGRLTESDYAALKASWITPDIADQANLRRVATFEGREVVGQKGDRDCAGILIPYYWPDECRPHTYRVRRDNPEWVEDKDGHPKPRRRYLGAPNSGNRLYIPPGVTLEHLKDVTIPIAVVEGEKKALALWRLANYETDAPRFIAIGIAGVWNWRGKVGKGNGPKGERVDLTGPIADLGRIEWKRRKSFVIFDCNVHSNPEVKGARKGLARELGSRAAKVELINLPEDCGVNGVDDLLAAWGPERVLELFNAAEPVRADERPSSQAEVLTRLAEEVELFHAPDGEAFARVQVEKHHETWLLRSRGFRRWLIKTFFQTLGKPPGAQALQDAIHVIEAKAHFESPEARLWIRVAELDGRIYIDLCNAEWQAIEVDAKGWRVVTDPPVRFRRTKGMQPLPQPTAGGSIAQLRKFINVGNDDNWVLCASWLVAACRPQGPFPILVLQGEQGCAKSTMEKFLRRIIDPSAALVRTPPRCDRDLLIAASNSWVIAYDNLSAIPQWLSDSLCRLATGGGFSTRELYTDSEEVFFEATRPVILNGIDHLPERADLADRALILNLPHIGNSNRKDEAQLYASFERDLPQILGALLTVVSAAIARAPYVTLANKPRMADFALWATAGEEALGLPKGAFLAAFVGNRAEAVRDTLEADPIGAGIVALMGESEAEGAGYWEGTCKELLEQLERPVDDRVKASREWPRTPRALSGRLRRLVTFLRETGLEISFQEKGAKGRRLLTITRTAAHLTAAIATTGASDGDCSATQSVTANPAGGGCVPRVAVELAGGDEPPPDLASAMALNGRTPDPRCGGGGEGGGYIHGQSQSPFPSDLDRVGSKQSAQTPALMDLNDVHE